MKHFITLLCIFSSICNALMAQEQTLSYGNTPFVYENSFGTGYVCGPNSYGDVGKYQRFDFVPAVKVKGTTFRMGVIQINGTADNLNVVVRQVASDGKPGATIQTKAINTAQLNLDTTGKRFDFDTPIDVAALGSIFIGLEWDAAIDDMFAITSDFDGEGEVADRAWEQFGDGTLQAINDQGAFAWGLDIDMFVKAHYVPASSATSNLDNEAFSFGPNHPNPFSSATNFEINLKSAAQRANLTIFDVTGRALRVVTEEARPAGPWTVRFQNDLPRGQYFARLDVDGRSAVRPINVQ
jgi:hypothetical protein